MNARFLAALTTSLLLVALVSAGCQEMSGADGRATVAGSNDGTAPAMMGSFEEDWGEQEQEIPLDEVPDAVKDAALAAVPGITLTGAETEVENGVRVFGLLGTVDGALYEVEVTEDAKVLEIELEDDDDDEDEDNEDD